MKRCDAPTQYNPAGRCQNPPMNGYTHCRHHLTPTERATRFARGMGITTDEALRRLKAVGWR